jgi:carboxypeptidase Q
MTDLHAKSRGYGVAMWLQGNEAVAPIFQFIQRRVQYSSRAHHLSLDVYDQIVAEDMMKNGVITAFFVYQTANRGHMLPREPLPKPTPSARPTTSQGQ